MMWKKLGAAGLLTFQQTQQVIGLVHKGSSNKRLMLPGGTCAVYSYGKLTVAVAETPSAIAAQNYVLIWLSCRKLAGCKLSSQTVF